MSLLARRYLGVNCVLFNGGFDLVRRLSGRGAAGEETLSKKEKLRKVDSVRKIGLKERKRAERFSNEDKFIKELKELPDPGILEPDPSKLAATYDEYEIERERMKTKFRRNKMTRKYYKELQPPKEFNFLTYGEKEEIRHLVQIDPSAYTPETLSKSFPISPEGVEKLLGSSFRAYCAAEVESHDQRVFDKVELAKSGKIPLTPQLKQKLEIRLKLPYKKSQLSRELVVKGPPGEFQSLVIEAEAKERISNDQNEFHRDHRSNWRHGHNGDQDDDTVTRALEQLGVSPDTKMTLKEFEETLRPKSDEVKANLILDYLLTMKTKEMKGEKQELEEMEENEKVKEKDKFVNFKKIIKFKETQRRILEESEPIEGNLNSTPKAIQERLAQDFAREAAKKDQEESSQVREMLKSQRVSADLVRIGKSYYNNKGEFLYKIF